MSTPHQLTTPPTIYRPYEYIKICKEQFGFHKEYLNALLQDKALFDFLFARVDEGFEPKTVAKWMVGPMKPVIDEMQMQGSQELEDFLTKFAQPFIDFLKLEQKKMLVDNQLKLVFEELLHSKKPVADIMKDKGFDTPAVSDDDLVNIVQTVINENPAIVAQYKGGKETTIGFFVGQVMKKTGGKINPQTAQQELKKQLQ
ncbi:MAG: hypothetical protein LBP53_06515 [Candidatus Peribacteria bacterium]|jgi:aspartyl-tRNA(Asn)/glutamyl-tRNA(Gln) amidotransferase subunit B|nr:hypothetical protein [Candidatus Peribacteria bacterium]